MSKLEEVVNESEPVRSGTTVCVGERVAATNVSQAGSDARQACFIVLALARANKVHPYIPGTTIVERKYQAARHTRKYFSSTVTSTAAMTWEGT